MAVYTWCHTAAIQLFKWLVGQNALGEARTRHKLHFSYPAFCKLLPTQPFTPPLISCSITKTMWRNESHNATSTLHPKSSQFRELFWQSGISWVSFSIPLKQLSLRYFETWKTVCVNVFREQYSWVRNSKSATCTCLYNADMPATKSG